MQCLHTSLIISHFSTIGLGAAGSIATCSTNATCRQVVPESCDVLSYDSPVKVNPSEGSSFHCLHATSHALQPMQSVVSVKKPVSLTASLAGRGGSRR